MKNILGNVIVVVVVVVVVVVAAAVAAVSAVAGVASATITYDVAARLEFVYLRSCQRTVIKRSSN